jgi:hypothetical protein
MFTEFAPIEVAKVIDEQGSLQAQVSSASGYQPKKGAKQLD